MVEEGVPFNAFNLQKVLVCPRRTLSLSSQLSAVRSEQSRAETRAFRVLDSAELIGFYFENVRSLPFSCTRS